MSQQFSEQLIELETKLQFQEDAIHQLDKVIIQQQRMIDTLSRRIELLEQKNKELSVLIEAGQVDEVDQKPPHY